jgi:CheY-like chemotaxis protein
MKGSGEKVTGTFSPTTTTREGGALDGQQSVLIVDHSDDTREVLQTALARRGLRTLAASGAGAGLELARRHHPDLIVLDLELDESGPDRLAARFAHPFGGDSPCPADGTARGNQTRLVMLGSLRRGPAGLPEGEFVPKPYHYGPLIRRIEVLLGTIPHAHSAGHASCPADGVARSD